MEYGVKRDIYNVAATASKHGVHVPSTYCKFLPYSATDTDSIFGTLGCFLEYILDYMHPIMYEDNITQLVSYLDGFGRILDFSLQQQHCVGCGLTRHWVVARVCMPY